MYEDFFGLREKAFSLTPDPKFLFMSHRHTEAFAHLAFGHQERGGFIVVTGEVGAGKTTLARYFLSRLGEETAVAVVLYPALTAAELLRSILDDLQVPAASPSLKDLVDALHGFLLEARRAGRTVVLLIDEAQDLSADVLEQVRLLSNLETDTEKLIQIVLLGQSELNEMLGRHELRQLSQRVTARYHLMPLSRGETFRYVRHRIEVAGGAGRVGFTPGALREVYRFSRGTPRLINLVCDRALLGGFAAGTRRIDRRLVRRASRELAGRPARRRAWLASAATLLLGAGALGAALLWRSAASSGSVAPSTAQAPLGEPAAALPAFASPEPGSQELASQDPASPTPVPQEPGPQEPASQEPASQEPGPQDSPSQESSSQEPASQGLASQGAPSQEPAAREPAQPEAVWSEPAWAASVWAASVWAAPVSPALVPPTPPLLPPAFLLPAFPGPVGPSATAQLSPAPVSPTPLFLPPPFLPPDSLPPAFLGPVGPSSTAQLSPALVSPAPAFLAPVSPTPVPSSPSSGPVPPADWPELARLSPAPASEPAHPSRLEDLIVSLPRQGSLDSAVAKIQALWAELGLERATLKADLALLEKLDLPAILEMSHPSRPDTCYVALVGLSDDRAQLSAAGTEVQAGWADVTALWTGQAIVMFKDFDGLTASRNPARTKARARQVLAALGYRAFGRDLSRPLARFQNDLGLAPDGILGPRTLVALCSRGPQPRPRLRSAS